MSKVLIIGGVAGGASAAARLRRLDETAEIIMFERDEYISFANCGLPYYIGGDITDRSLLTLQTPESFHSRFNVDVRVLSEVTAIHPDTKTVTVLDKKSGKTYEESYDKLILSPGAKPTKPNIIGVENEKVFTLRNIPDTYRIKDYIDQEKPKSAVIVGGGYIGIEMAENMHNAGLDVTIVEFADHVIAPLDYDMAADVHNHIREKGVKLILQDGVKSISDYNNQLKIKLSGGELLTDVVILSVGVTPDTTLATSASLELNKRGAIIVDEHMRTSVPDIYAVGDAIEITDYITKEQGYIPLAGPANKQGRIAADNICGLDSVYKGTQGTGILKCFDITVATTGITEKRAKELSLDYEKSFTYSGSHASYYPGAVNMSVKIIFEKSTGKLLGAQVVGFDGADKRLDVLATAIRAGFTIYDLTELELAYAPPFSSAKDPVNMAGFVAENILTKKTNIFHWNEVDTLPRDGSVSLIDIRTQMEYDNGTIDGFINIPVDELRANLHRIDKSKPVYVTCQIGLRGHIASRILTQNGYTCYNLSGGYRLYNSIRMSEQNTAGMNTPEQTLQAASLDSTNGSMLKKNSNNEGDNKMNDSVNKMNENVKTVEVNACGLQCPGPILKLNDEMKKINEGELLKIKTTDPAFSTDVISWCKRTGNTFIDSKSSKGVSTALIRKGGLELPTLESRGNNKNIIVFSGDLDKAIASFIIANAAAAMGRKVSMFFTFWGLNVLRKPEKVSVKKDFVSRMFGVMLPRNTKKLPISKMNMGGMGPRMIRAVMKNKNIDSLEDLIKEAMKNGVELIACTMSMDVMGIHKDELIDGVKTGGAATMLDNAEESDMSLFI
ncbi:CoA-disulfide reductase [Anaeromicropila herbilytica]|uniref:CoA-disulfide reductase n=1 Tax=Anaeromicropila herbilytica TaxID=2785025 RepID=A0A7R7EJS4_9FIRM|nr:CoA-disulfide reductase [Anaeromicropila herbilytica]BCN30073.1 CoA-disulfide reductase [Anaeromicropila herbilytica]